MIPLTTEEKIYHNKQKICYIIYIIIVIEFNNNRIIELYIIIYNYI